METPSFGIVLDKEMGIVIEVQSPFSFVTEYGTYVVEEGYRSEGYSAPRFLWSLLSPAIDERTLIPAICHDWLYDHQVMTRRQADRVFLDMLVENGFPRWKAWLSYAGVRLFGWIHW